MIAYEWRGAFDNPEINALHAEGFGHRLLDDDWWAQVNRHSLGWVTARAGTERARTLVARAGTARDGGDLVGFLNVAWDGAIHAFILDPVVAVPMRRHRVGTRLVEIAANEARAAGCEWLHVDFDDHLRSFYFDACGFTPTNAGLVRL